MDRSQGPREGSGEVVVPWNYGSHTLVNFKNLRALGITRDLLKIVPSNTCVLLGIGGTLKGSWELGGRRGRGMTKVILYR